MTVVQIKPWTRRSRTGDYALLRSNPPLLVAFLGAWGGRCVYCDVQLTASRGPSEGRPWERSEGPSPLHVDHIISVVDGGGDHMENLCPSCGPCNMSKGSAALDREVAISLFDRASKVKDHLGPALAREGNDPRGVPGDLGKVLAEVHRLRAENAALKRDLSLAADSVRLVKRWQEHADRAEESRRRAAERATDFDREARHWRGRAGEAETIAAVTQARLEERDRLLAERAERITDLQARLSWLGRPWWRRLGRG